MASQPVKIVLAPEETLGRRFQYAFVSYAISRGVSLEWSPYSGIIEFYSRRDFVLAVEEAYNAIVSALSLKMPRKGCKSIPRPRSPDCCMLDDGPSLYASGGRYEAEIFAEAGLDKKCAILGGKKGGRKGGAEARWAHAAISYAEEVIEAGGPLGGIGEYDIPWTAKATIFSKKRASIGSIVRVRPKLGKDSLGVLLLGASIAYLGKHRFAKETIEFYLVPENPSRGYADLRNIVVVGGIGQGPGSNISGIAAWLSSNLGVSLEIAIALALASKIADAAVTASDLDLTGSFSSSTIYTVRPQQRPMVTAGIPLLPSIAKAFSKEAVRALLGFASTVIGLIAKKVDVKGADNTAAKCINAAFLQSMDPCWTDHLVECIRELDSISTMKLGGVSGLAASLKNLLSRDYDALVSAECAG